MTVRKLKDVHPIGILLAAHLPLLISYYFSLWRLEHFRFFPFALIAFLFFVRDRLPLRQLGALRYRDMCLVGLDVLLLIFGSLLHAPWLVAVGAVCLIFVWLSHQTDREFDCSGGYLIMLPALALRPPLNWDVQLIQALQPMTSTTASLILNFMGILHVRHGNVLEFPDKRFMVEEACSGVQSLFSVLFVAVLISVVMRRTIPFLIALVVCAVGFAVFMNSLRVTSVAAAWGIWQLDISSGWQHDAIGYLALLLSAGLVLSADAFLAFLTSPVPSEEYSDYFLAKCAFWNRLFNIPPREHPDLMQPLEADASRKSSGYVKKIAVIIFAVIILAQIGSLLIELPNTRPIVSAPELFPENALPAELGSFSKSSFAQETRGEHDRNGHFSSVWTYQNKLTVTRIACDHPFTGWHDLEVCYTAIGWEILDRRFIEADGWVAKFVSMRHPNELKSGVLCFSLFDEFGSPCTPQGSGAILKDIANRLRHSSNLVTFQCQCLIVSDAMPTADRIEQLIEVHRLAREKLRTLFTSAVRSPN